MRERWQYHLLGSCLVINFVWPFLLGFAFSPVRPWEYGIRLNRNTMKFGESPPRTWGRERDDAGRKFVGLGQEFIYFPKARPRARARADLIRARSRPAARRRCATSR